MKAKIFATVMTLMLPFLSFLKLGASELRQPVSVEAAKYIVSSSERLSDADLSVLAFVAERYGLESLEAKVKEAAELRLEGAADRGTEELGYFFELYEESSDVRFRRALRAKWNNIKSEHSFDSYAFRAEYARRYGPKDQRDSIYSAVVSRFLSSRERGRLKAMLSALDNLPEKHEAHKVVAAVEEELASESESEEDWQYITGNAINLKGIGFTPAQ